ncbi:MAG: hypothetical protein J6A67_05855 [Clostridia bacterium]|nr:hypothetical protein [Clostridia bacterium]
MKKHSGFIKNIIMVVASALTLVAVSFAWFTNNFETNLDEYKAVVSGDVLKVDFYQADESGAYQPLAGDIELNEFVPGNYNKYKFLVTTKTADKLKMSFNIANLPEDIPQELSESVCIKYSVYSTTKKTLADGTVSYTDKTMIAQSEQYVPLADLSEGTIFSSLSLEEYQKKSGDVFAIYYEIGLSENAPASVSGLESSLGSIQINAQRIS